MKEKDEQLNLLYELLHYMLYNSHNPVQVGRQALTLIQKLLVIFRGEIYYLNNQQQLELLATSGYEAVDTAAYEGWEKHRLEQQLIRLVVETGKGVTIPDVNCEEMWLPVSGLDEGICSIAVFPLSTAEKTVGVMVLSSEQPDYFTGELVPFLTAVASSVALSLQNAYLFQQAQTGKDQLHLLAAQLLATQENERRNLSHKLHDEAGQLLTTLQMQLIVMEKNLSNENPTREELRKAQQILSEVIQRLSFLAYSLHPPELDLLGLNSTLKILCREYAPQSGFAISYSGVANLPSLSEMAGISFFYCLLEALKNVDKHAFASHVDVNLSYNDDYVYLRVKDDGIGFTATTIREVNEEGIGLVGIKERSESNEGFMKIESEKGQGTTLTVAIPRLDAPEGA
jgi:signal transduction histidine kinase